jgi:hypothetical protein
MTVTDFAEIKGVTIDTTIAGSPLLHVIYDEKVTLTDNSGNDVVTSRKLLVSYNGKDCLMTLINGSDADVAELNRFHTEMNPVELGRVTIEDGRNYSRCDELLDPIFYVDVEDKLSIMVSNTKIKSDKAFRDEPWIVNNSGPIIRTDEFIFPIQ